METEDTLQKGVLRNLKKHVTNVERVDIIQVNALMKLKKLKKCGNVLTVLSSSKQNKNANVMKNHVVGRLKNGDVNTVTEHLQHSLVVEFMNVHVQIKLSMNLQKNQGTVIDVDVQVIIRLTAMLDLI